MNEVKTKQKTVYIDHSYTDRIWSCDFCHQECDIYIHVVMPDMVFFKSMCIPCYKRLITAGLEVMTEVPE